jgi:hypothetical protein
MDGLRDLSEKSLALIFQNYTVVLSLLCLVLAFALYIYFFRNTIAEYFATKKPTPAKEQAPAPRNFAQPV